MARRRRKLSPETRAEIARLKTEIDALLDERDQMPFPDVSGLSDIAEALRDGRPLATSYSEQRPLIHA